MNKTTNIDIELKPKEVFQAIRASEFAPRGVEMYDVDLNKDTIVFTESQYGDRTYLSVVVEEE